MRQTTIYRIQVLVGLLVLAIGGAKLAGIDLMVRHFELVGLGQWFRVASGLVEVASGICLLVPRAAVIGALLVCGVLAGSIGAMLGHAAQAAFTPVRPAAPHVTVSRVRQAGLVERHVRIGGQRRGATSA